MPIATFTSTRREQGSGFTVNPTWYLGDIAAQSADRTPLFVRLPTREAESLDRAAARLGTSKGRIVADLLAAHLEPPSGIDALKGAPVGRHEFTQIQKLEVLTLEQLATLLELDVEVVGALAGRGDIPGRKLGDEWRFSRAAILAWLAGE
jgi:Helix-turn-helix domain